MEYEAVIGLEVHAELLTATKLFCSCLNRFGSEANIQVCPVCLGLPGVLPVVNQKAVEFLIMTARAVDGKVAAFSKFDRKNYFYPDMPKNFQISQYDLPLCDGGAVPIEIEGREKLIPLKRIHLEEDTGKSVHQGAIHQSAYTLEDYNRAGVPLMEIVTEPAIASPQEAYAYLTSLKQLLKWLEVSDCKMEEGSLRCDANVSVRPVGQTELGVKTEVKNMNSFKSVESALKFEIERQINLLKEGKTIDQETRGWDENQLLTFSMRSKEEVQDYRYFPEPDLVPLQIEAARIKEIAEKMPALPQELKQQIISQHKLPEETAQILVKSRFFVDFFLKAVELFPNPAQVANWMLGDINGWLNANNLELEEAKLTPENLAEMLKMIDSGKISGKIGKEILPETLIDGSKVEEMVEKRGLSQISNPAQLKELAQKVLNANPDAVNKFKAGKNEALGFLVGQAMKESRGRANPELVNQILKAELEIA